MEFCPSFPALTLMFLILETADSLWDLHHFTPPSNPWAFKLGQELKSLSFLVLRYLDLHFAGNRLWEFSTSIIMWTNSWNKSPLVSLKPIVFVSLENPDKQFELPIGLPDQADEQVGVCTSLTFSEKLQSENIWHQHIAGGLSFGTRYTLIDRASRRGRIIVRQSQMRLAWRGRGCEYSLWCQGTTERERCPLAQVKTTS